MSQSNVQMSIHELLAILSNFLQALYIVCVSDKPS